MASEMATLIGRNLRQRRGELRLTQRQVAERLREINPQLAGDSQRVSDWERGSSRPTEPYEKALCQALDRDWSWFLATHDEAETPDPFANGDVPQLDRIEQALAEIQATVSALQASVDRLTGETTMDEPDEDADQPAPPAPVLPPLPSRTGARTTRRGRAS